MHYEQLPQSISIRLNLDAYKNKFEDLSYYLNNVKVEKPLNRFNMCFEYEYLCLSI